MEELVYTSAPQGLRSGSSGFCTVEMTAGMSPEMMDSLESLSAYDNDPSKTVNWMHVRSNILGGPRHVLSRVGPLRGEFSGRTNKLAHHLCLAPGELPPGGPMRIVGRGGPLRQEWSGQVRQLQPQAAPTSLRVASTPRVCRSWASAVGDAGVAGAVLARLGQGGSNPVWVIRTPQMDALAMIDEMLSLMSGQQRWGVTFCTYLHTLPRSAECRLRWVVANSPAMQQLHNIGPDQLIDLREGADAILRGVDDALVDAARRGEAIAGVGRSLPTSRASLGAAGRPSRQRAISHVDLRDRRFASDPTGQAIVPPPKAQPTSLLMWIMMGAALAIVPISGLLYFLILRDPEPVVAMRDSEAQGQSIQPAVVVTNVAPDPQGLEQPSSSNHASDQHSSAKPNVDAGPTKPPGKVKPPGGRKKPKPTPKVPGPAKPKSEIPQAIQVSLKLPTSALNFSLDAQPLHQGLGAYEVALNPIAPVYGSWQFGLAAPDALGDRDLMAVRATDEPRKIGTIATAPDQVLFAWSPDTNRDLASAFLVAHELLIKDETHHTTIRFDFAKPRAVPSPPVPAARFEVAVPPWILPETQCWVQPTFFSDTSSQPVKLKTLLVSQSADEMVPVSRKEDISSLEDPFLRQAIFSAAADMIGSGENRRIRFTSMLQLQGSGQKFEWSQRRAGLREQVEKYNKQELKKNPKERNLMSLSERYEKFETWGSQLRCELEIFARVNGRDILWGKSGGETQ